ncbi:hypothetical protein MF672_021460 [Actinomadura sp. ATCC 31491]|uniref:DUF2267 domain-containing protein n=1 Tax=Actinomadura luzonensis TaxID=2805427 RepID=A0ABT0FVJ5_9ACTN|nr:hypothetical protein [Actinomadura luzonensis]MCK2216349.1 hypothetical protein [Actinomadura luzonensis]
MGSSTETFTDVADDVMPFATAAIGAYGASVLAKTSELAADTPVALGTRLLQRVFGRGDAWSRGLVAQVAEAKPDDVPAHAALRSAIVAAFGDDPALSREVAAMLPRSSVSGYGL